jgi:hypothetical protein
MLGMRLPSTLAVAWHTREEKIDYLSLELGASLLKRSAVKTSVETRVLIKVGASVYHLPWFISPIVSPYCCL